MHLLRRRSPHQAFYFLASGKRLLRHYAPPRGGRASARRIQKRQKNFFSICFDMVSPEISPKRQVYPRSRAEKGVNKGVELRREIEREFAGNIFTLRGVEVFYGFVNASQLRSRGAAYIPDCVNS